jgi:protein TonB
MMLALIGAMVFIGGLLHVPFGSDLSRVGWSVRQLSDQRLVETREFRILSNVGGVIPTVLEQAPPQEPQSRARTEELTVGDAAGEATRREAVRLQARTVLEFAEKAPQVVGGMGSYYINIEYPEEAVEMGIEGQLVLRFVVEPDGTTSDIAVYKSLHPLCDSAAVRALRLTRFAPGEQDGQFVPVRMSLPVRFRLVEPGTRTAIPGVRKVRAAQLD